MNFRRSLGSAVAAILIVAPAACASLATDKIEPQRSKGPAAFVPPPAVPEKTAAPVATDARYLFVDKWQEFSDKSGTFLPTVAAKHSSINTEHLSLQDGALLVRAGMKPLFISQNVSGQKVVTRVAGGALVLVSAMDGHATILNLTDKCCGALVVYVPSSDSKELGPIHITAGQIAEVCPLASSPLSHAVSTKIIRNEKRTNELGLLQSQCDYTQALKKYNLENKLEPADLARIFKPPTDEGEAKKAEGGHR